MKHLIKVALVLLAGVAAYLVYGFTAAVAPWAVAALAAGSLVGTYIGLAFAEIPDGQQSNAVRVAVAAMVVEALYGTLYVLSLQYPAFFAQPPVWAAVPLAALHGASFSVLAFFVSLFVFHAQRGHAQATTPEERVALILAEALRPVVAPPAQLPEQVTYPRPQAATTDMHDVAIAEPQPADPWACAACGAVATTGQRGAAGRHGYWSCKGCGARQYRHKRT